MKRATILIPMTFLVFSSLYCSRSVDGHGHSLFPGEGESFPILTSGEMSDIDQYNRNIIERASNFPVGLGGNADLDRGPEVSDYAEYRRRMAELREKIGANSHLESYISRLEDSSSFATSSDYLGHVERLKEEAMADRSLMSHERKTIAVAAYSLSSFIKLNDDRDHSLHGIDPRTLSLESWWNSWGRCAVGIIGGGISGALAGASYSSVIPVLGSVFGAILGFVSGTLIGAQRSC